MSDKYREYAERITDRLSGVPAETLEWYELRAFVEAELRALVDAEREKMQEWVNDLQSGVYINCVYCGHRYGPSDEVPASMADVLKEHIEQCPKHPMSSLKKKVELYKALAETKQKQLHQISDPLEAALVRLGHRPIQLKHQVEGCKWRWSCHVQEAHTLDWYKTTGDTPSEAVEAAGKEISNPDLESSRGSSCSKWGPKPPK